MNKNEVAIHVLLTAFYLGASSMFGPILLVAVPLHIWYLRQRKRTIALKSSDAELQLPSAVKGHAQAYVAYLVLGMIALWTSVLMFSFRGQETIDLPSFGAGVGLLVVIPLGIPMLIAAGYAVWQTIKLHNDIALLLLLVLSVLICILLYTMEPQSWFDFLLVYGVTCIVVTLSWFWRRHDRVLN